MLPLLFSRKEFGIWGVGVVTIQCVLAFRYRQQSQEMGKAVPRMRWRACWACEHKLWVSVHSPVGRVCRNGMRKRASRLWRRYLCHCPITSLPLWVIQTDKWLAPRWVHLLLCLFSVHLILCAFHFAAYSLLIDRGSREIYGIPGKNKLILLGALLRRMEITGFSQRLAVSLEVSELKTVLYIGLSDGDDCAGRSPRVANVLILQYSPPFLSFSILNNVCVPLTS